MANSADPDQLASLIWIYTVCKGRVYPGSAGQGLNWSEIIQAHTTKKEKKMGMSA